MPASDPAGSSSALAFTSRALLTATMNSIDACASEGYRLACAGRFGDAIPFYEKSIRLSEQEGQVHDSGFVLALHSLAGCLTQVQKYAAVLPVAERALKLVASLAATDPAVTAVHGSLEYLRGRSLLSLDRVTEATASLEIARGFLQLAGSGNENELVEVLLLLSSILLLTDRDEMGLAALHQIDATCSSSMGYTMTVIQQLTYYNYQADLLAGLGRNDDACAALHRSVALATQVYGASSEEAASVLAKLGQHYCFAHRVDDAKQALRQADAVLTKLGKRNTLVYVSYLEAMGLLLIKTGGKAAAVAAYEKALVIRRSLLPPRDPAITANLSALSSLHDFAGNRAASAETAAAAALLTRRSQTACAGPGCNRQLREDGAPLDVCVKCRRTCYCSKECQTADWYRGGGHKAECKALIAEEAAAATASVSAVATPETGSKGKGGSSAARAPGK